MLAVDGRVHRSPERFEDDYTLESTKLGDGFSGAVVAARCKATGAKCAVKTFRMHSWTDERRRHVMNEIDINLCMDHPHVVRMSAVYVSQETVRIVLERMDGGELFTRLLNEYRFSEADASHSSRQMLLALNYLHKQGVCHRDIKMENFLYSHEGGSWLKLIDFGFATFFNEEDHMAERLGTVRYVAPEVLVQDYTGGTCDMWSLGVIVYALLIGNLPFDRHSTSATAEAIMAGAYDTRCGPWGGVSTQGREFVHQLLTVDPLARPTAEQALNHPFVRERYRNIEATHRLDRYVGAAFGCFAQGSPFKQACLQIVASSLTTDERFELEVAFAEFEKSHTGMISPDELQNLVQDNVEAQEFVAVMKQQGRQLRCSDFVAAMVAVRPRHFESSIRAAFRRFDLGSRDVTSSTISHCGDAACDMRPSRSEWSVDMEHVSLSMTEDDLVKFLCAGRGPQAELQAPPRVGSSLSASPPSPRTAKKGLRASPWAVGTLAFLADFLVGMCGPSMLPTGGLR